MSYSEAALKCFSCWGSFLKVPAGVQHPSNKDMWLFFQLILLLCFTVVWGLCAKHRKQITAGKDFADIIKFGPLPQTQS